MSGDLEQPGLGAKGFGLALEPGDALIASLQEALGAQYRIERELGRGGMGIVYLARDLTLDRPVAVKVLQPELSTNRVLAARFLAEARTIAKLRHPTIVAVHVAGEIAGHLYYVMDYLSGETLRQRLSRGRLATPAAIRIATDIAQALDAASEAGIIHRDLKPENILLEGSEAEPRALLADFGIARLVEGGSGHTGPGAVMGTPAYMSPEQAAGETIDGRSDIYSLGIVTYEMFAGAPPFDGPHRTVLSKQILDPVTPLELRRPDTPRAVSSAVMRALEKVPEARWDSGKAFAAALVADGPGRPTGSWWKRLRSRSRLLAGAVIVALGTIATVLTSRRGGPPDGVDPRHSILVLPFENLREEPTYDWLEAGSVNMLTLALSQWRDLTVVDQDRVHDLIERTGDDEGQIGLELARRLARTAKVWTVVLGDYTKAGDSLHLVARTYDVASGRRLDVVQVDGPASDDVRPLFDELATKLLDLTGAPPADRASVTSVTTESVEAYRAYLRGIDALSHWRLARASNEFERAIGIDSGFSLASYKLAVVRGWISATDTLGIAAIQRAARTSERLPARDRQLIEAYRTFTTGDRLQGATLYGELIRQDSTDADAWYGLADATFHAAYERERVDLLTESLRNFRRVIALDSTYGLAYEHIGAMLTDASSPIGRFALVSADSFAIRKGPGAGSLDSTTEAAAIARARREAVGLAQSWTRLQPNTPRAHYHLYKALLASGRAPEARQTLTQLRALYSDSLQPVFGLLEARAQFVEGDVLGASRTVRGVLPRIQPRLFGELDFAPEPVVDAMTGVSALGYQGDVQGATELIRTGRALYEQRIEARDSTDKLRHNEIWELSRLAQLHGATGTQPERLRSIFDRGVALARSVLPKERPMVANHFAAAAVGLLIGPTADVDAVAEMEKASGQPSPPAVKALVAIRQGDTAAARGWLARAEAPRKPDTASVWGATDQRPLLAAAHFELGEFDKVVTVLEDFQPEAFSTRGFDPRWVLYPRIRLLRGSALEQLRRQAEAAVEYRAVIEQWGGADAELLPIVQRARQGLARVEGIPETR